MNNLLTSLLLLAVITGCSKQNIEGQIILRLANGSNLTPSGVEVSAFNLSDVIKALNGRRDMWERCPTDAEYIEMITKADSPLRQIKSFDACSTKHLVPTFVEPVARAKTDQNGRFNMTLTSNQPTVLVAEMTRRVGLETETLQWMQVISKGHTVTLDNSNQITPESFYPLVSDITSTAK